MKWAGMVGPPSKEIPHSVRLHYTSVRLPKQLVQAGRQIQASMLEERVDIATDVDDGRCSSLFWSVAD